MVFLLATSGWALDLLPARIYRGETTIPPRWVRAKRRPIRRPVFANAPAQGDAPKDHRGARDKVGEIPPLKRRVRESGFPRPTDARCSRARAHGESQSKSCPKPNPNPRG